MGLPERHTWNNWTLYTIKDLDLPLEHIAHLLLKAYTQMQMNHLLHLDVKNCLSNTLQSWNLAHLSQLMTAPSTRNTSNTLKEKKKQ